MSGEDKRVAFSLPGHPILNGRVQSFVDLAIPVGVFKDFAVSSPQQYALMVVDQVRSGIIINTPLFNRSGKEFANSSPHQIGLRALGKSSLAQEPGIGSGIYPERNVYLSYIKNVLQPGDADWNQVSFRVLGQGLAQEPGSRSVIYPVPNGYLRDIKRALQPGGVASCGRGVLRSGPMQDAVHFRQLFSFRTPFQFVSRRSMSGGAKSRQDLLAWEQSLEKREQLLDVERMGLDGIRVRLTSSWKNLGNVEKRLPSPDSLGFIKSIIHEKAALFVRAGVAVVCTNALWAVVVVYSLKPGEAAKIPGNVRRILETRWHSFVDWSRERVGLTAFHKVTPVPESPAAPSLPSQFVVVMDGSRPLLTGSIVVPSSDSSGKEHPQGSK